MKDVALLGFAQASTRQLGLSENVYSLGRQYNDSYVGAVVRDYAFRRQNIGTPVQAYDPTYNRASSRMFRTFGAMFPADFIVRMYASAWAVLRLPASSAYEQQPLPYIGSQSLFGRLYARRKQIVAHMIKVSLFPVVAAIGLLGYDSIRKGAGVACLIAYFAFYPAIQFWPRHYFHLNVIAVAAALFVVSRIASGWRSHRRIRVPRAIVIGLLLASTAVGMWLVLLAARAYQDTVVRRHIDMLIASEWQPVDLQMSLGPDGIRIARFARLPAQEEAYRLRGVVRSEYLRLRIVRQSGCSPDPLPVIVAYKRPFASLSHVLTFPAANPNRTTTEMLFAAYYSFGEDPADHAVGCCHCMLLLSACGDDVDRERERGVAPALHRREDRRARVCHLAHAVDQRFVGVFQFEARVVGKVVRQRVYPSVAVGLGGFDFHAVVNLGNLGHVEGQQVLARDQSPPTHALTGRLPCFDKVGGQFFNLCAVAQVGTQFRAVGSHERA